MNAHLKTFLITFLASVVGGIITSFFIAYVAKDLTGKVIGEIKPRLNVRHDSF